MKHIILATLLTASCFSCGKSVTPTPPIQPPPPVAGQLAITSFSPKQPYPSDVLTIEGSGFGNDPAAVTVQLGFYIAGSFNVFQPQQNNVPVPLKVKTVSDTKITVQVSDSVLFEMDREAYTDNDANGKGIPNFVIRVSTKGNDAFTSAIPYRRLLRVNKIESLSSIGAQILRAGDSVYFFGGGFTRNKCDLKVYLVGPGCSSCSEVPQSDPNFHTYHVSGQCHCTEKTLLVACAGGRDFESDSSEYAGYTTGYLRFRMPNLFQHTFDGSKIYDWVTYGLIVEDADGHQFVDSAAVYLYPSN